MIRVYRSFAAAENPAQVGSPVGWTDRPRIDEEATMTAVRPLLKNADRLVICSLTAEEGVS